MSVGKRLRTLRQKTKRTLKEQSELFGVSLNSVYRWEHDLALPKKSLLRKIADFYDVPFEWLLHGSVSEEAAEEIINSSDGNNIEKQLLRMFRNMSTNNRYKILGYVERLCIQDMEEKMFDELGVEGKIS